MNFQKFSVKLWRHLVAALPSKKANLESGYEEEQLFVYLGEGDEGEERLVGFRLALDEINGAPGQFRINVTSRNQIVRFDGLWLFAPLRLLDKRLDSNFRIVLELRAVLSLISGIGDDIPLIETLIGGETARGIPKMPFAIHCCHVSLFGEQLGHGLLHCVIPYSMPQTTLVVPERMGCLPVIRAERLGVHCGSTLKFVSRSPSAASLSSRGVGAPLSSPPP
jgi:hypothetical protein